jgi:hypothetical protein
VPVAPIRLLDQALDDLSAAVTLTALPATPTHTALAAEGVEDPRATLALGRYLVGAVAGAIDLDATVSAALLGQGPDARAELERSIRRLVGDNNRFESAQEVQFRDSWRNAWIAEGIAHALLVVRARAETLCVSGPVHAVSAAHTLPTEPGLDAVAIYSEGDQPVIVVGESKASQCDGSSRLTEAAGIFSGIDQGDYGPELRSHLLALRRVVPVDIASRISESLWRDERCYLPVVVHETPFDPLAERETLGRLAPPVERRRVLIVRLSDFHGFFDAVSDAMRAAVPEVIL